MKPLLVLWWYRQPLSFPFVSALPITIQWQHPSLPIVAAAVYLYLILSVASALWWGLHLPPPPGTPIGTWRRRGSFWHGYTRVRWLAHRTQIGTPKMQIGTLSGNRDETPRQDAEGETETPSGESPRATPRRRATNCQGQHREAKGNTKSRTIRCVNHWGKCQKVDLPRTDLNVWPDRRWKSDERKFELAPSMSNDITLATDAYLSAVNLVQK